MNETKPFAMRIVRPVLVRHIDEDGALLDEERDPGTVEVTLILQEIGGEVRYALPRMKDGPELGLLITALRAAYNAGVYRGVQDS